MLFGVPVSVENDANCAALAEVWLGAARDVQNALFIVIGSGIGGAVIVNRQLFKGKNLFGGEFGYMLLDAENTLSRLGSPVQVAERYGKAMEMSDGVVGREVPVRKSGRRRTNGCSVCGWHDRCFGAWNL